MATKKLIKFESKSKAQWLPSKKMIFQQVLVSFWSYITLPFFKSKDDATCSFFKKNYTEKPDPLIFDGHSNNYFNQIFSLIKCPKLYNRTIIDLGSGTASFYEWLLDNGARGIKYIGVDFALESRRLDYRSEIISGDLKNIDLTEIERPLVMISNVLCYLNTDSVRQVFNKLPINTDILILEPYPCLFWDAHFAGIKLNYRKPKKICTILETVGYEISSINVSHGIRLFDHLICPISYVLYAHKNS